MWDHAFKVNMLDLNVGEIRSMGLTRGFACWVCDYLGALLKYLFGCQSVRLSTSGK